MTCKADPTSPWRDPAQSDGTTRKAGMVQESPATHTIPTSGGINMTGPGSDPGRFEKDIQTRVRTEEATRVRAHGEESSESFRIHRIPERRQSPPPGTGRTWTSTDEWAQREWSTAPPRDNASSTRCPQ